jgi:hypothetical protein
VLPGLTLGGKHGEAVGGVMLYDGTSACGKKLVRDMCRGERAPFDGSGISLTYHQFGSG